MVTVIIMYIVGCRSVVQLGVSAPGFIWVDLPKVGACRSILFTESWYKEHLADFVISLYFLSLLNALRSGKVSQSNINCNSMKEMFVVADWTNSNLKITTHQFGWYLTPSLHPATPIHIFRGEGECALRSQPFPFLNIAAWLIFPPLAGLSLSHHIA